MGFSLTQAGVMVTAAQGAGGLHDVAFSLFIAGLFGVWVGGGNMVARRFAVHRWGRLGGERAVWMKRGFFILPDWMSVIVLAAGAASLVTAGILSAI